MNVTVETTNDVRRKVTLVVPAAEVSKIYKQVITKVGSRARIKGFRPGKAPRRLLERRFGPMIREEVLDRVLTRNIPAAIEEGKLEPMGQPELDEIGDLRDGEDLSVAFSVEVLPTLELTDWQGAELAIPTCEADDQDLDQELQKIADNFGEVVSVDSADNDADQVQLTYTIHRAEDDGSGDTGEPIERRFMVGGSHPDEWVDGAIRGAKVGDTFEVDEYTLEEDDERPAAGKVKGEILGIQRRVVPEIDDGLAKKDGRFETLDELKADLKAEQERLAARRAEQWRRDFALDHVLNANPFTVPRALIDREVDHRIARTFGPQALQKGSQLHGLMGQLRDTMKPEAVTNVRRALVVKHLIESGEIDVTDEEIDAQLDKIESEFKELTDKAKAQMRSDDGRQQTREMLQQEKALDGLLAELKVTDGDTLHLRDPNPSLPIEQPEAAEDEANPGHGEEGHVHGPNCSHDH